jgi:hypothetical protein
VLFCQYQGRLTRDYSQRDDTASDNISAANSQYADCLDMIERSRLDDCASCSDGVAEDGCSGVPK